MKNGFTFCTCSVNQYYCNHTHAQYRLETPAEFKRYLPVAMASFATGNNIWGENSRADGGGTSTAFMKRATEAYGLYFTLTKDRDAALSALEDGAWSSPQPAARPAVYRRRPLPDPRQRI